MALYHPGMSNALAKVDSMTESECLAMMDSLCGRDNLRYGDDLEALQKETRRQIREAFTDRADPGWEAANFWSKVIAAQMRSR